MTYNVRVGLLICTETKYTALNILSMVFLLNLERSTRKVALRKKTWTKTTRLDTKRVVSNTI
jgi:hypothetical protein